MDLQFVTHFMLQNFKLTTIQNNGTHFIARCLLCGDSAKNKYKKRFNLNWNNGVPGWHCWNCGRHGNFIEIYSIVKGMSYDDAKKELFKWQGKEETKEQYKKDSKNIKSVSINEPRKEKLIKEDNFNFILNKCYGLFSDNSGILAKKYIQVLKDFYESRKIPIKYKIYICHTGKYKNRIIIPIFNENKDVIYFQARRIPNSGVLPKYDNPISPKELCIINRYKFNPEKNIIIHEGLIDAFMVGDQGTSCLGKEISEELLKELLKLTKKSVIIALDNDIEAYKSLNKFLKKNKYAKKVKYFLYPKQFEGYSDINEFVKVNEDENDIYDVIVENSVNYSTALVKLKIKKLI